MGSRLKENPERTFYWCFEASCPIARDKDPGVLFQFPEDFCDEESLQMLPRFCFPYDIERVKDTVAVQHFTFVLTDLEGCQRFGFCRLTSSSQTCLCILSYLPWFEVFYKLLNNLADYLTKGQTNEMRELLATLYKHPVPLADGSVYLQLGEQLQLRTGVPQPSGHMPLPNGEGAEGVPYFIAPDPRSLPSIPESRNLTELVVAVDVGNLLQLYASMLFERRILIYCSKLSTLTACVHACSGMLFPMYWQHIFIPVLPPHLLDYCCAPMPYLIGVHSSQTEKVRSRALEDVVIFNVDTNTMESPFEDLKKIPSDVVAALKVRLKKQSTSAGSGVARAFLRAQAVLFGGYRDALQYPPGGSIFFSEESFLDHKSHSMKQFLESAIHLQSFKQFIDGRLEQLNKGREPADIFEEEILQCGASAGGTRSYQQWVGNLKKGGGALLLKSKAHLYRAAKSHNKFGLRNFLSAKEDELHSLQRGGSISDTHTYRRVQSDCLQSRLPITQHFGRSRPRRPARGFASQQEDELQQESSNWRPAWEDGAVDCLEQVSGEAEDLEPSLMPDPEEMDLLGEIFDTLSAQTSMEHGLLYGTRSLDLFGPDSTDFITRREMAAPSQESLNISTGPSGSLRSWEEGLEEQGEGPGGLQEGPDESGEGPSGVGDGLEDEARRMEEEAGNLKEGLKEELGYHWSRQDRQVYGMGAGLDEQVEKRVQSDGLGAELNDQDGLKEMEEEEEEKGRGGPSGPRTRDDKEQEDGVEEKRNVRVNEELQREKKSCSVPDPGPSPVAPTQRGVLRPGADRERDAPKTTHTGAAQASSSRSTTSQEEREEEKESSAPPSHRVMSAVALFQVRASHDRKAQPRVSPEAGKPSSSCRGGDWALKNTPQGPGTQASSNGPSVGTQPDEPAANSPVVVTPAVTSATAPDSLNKEEGPPLPKVSEMKKRFEL